MAASFAQFCTPLYATIANAESMAITTTTISSSTMVNPEFLFFAHIDGYSIYQVPTMVNDPRVILD